MKAIFKYELEVTDQQSIEMPQGAVILSAQVQKCKICIWALVDSGALYERRVFRVIGTGDEIEDGVFHRFIGTVQMLDGRLVWHIFEIVTG